MSKLSQAPVAAVAAAGLFVLVSAAAPHAQHHGTGAHKLGPLTVEAPWARASAGAARAGAAYLRIVNAGPEDDWLTAISSPVAGRAELHSHVMTDGVMRMRRIGSVRVPGGQSAELKPGGDHVMLFGLTAPLKKGGTFPLTLAFEKAGTVTVSVAILPITARGPGTKRHGQH